jgi:hypothetical protein
MARATFCSTTSSVVPSRFTAARVSKIVFTTTGASPRLGSSSMSRVGRAIRPRPIAHICCSPPESVPASWPTRSSRRGKSEKTHESVSARRARAAGVTAPSSRFSRTLMVGKSWRPSGTWTMPRATARAGEGRTSGSPCHSMRPRRSGSRPEIARSVVVFPAPLLPMRATASPARTSSDRPCTAVRSP